MNPRYSVVHDVEEALAQVPAHFDRQDIIRILGYTPPRTTLLRALNWLQAEGTIKIEDHSSGGKKVRYRKLR